MKKLMLLTLLFLMVLPATAQELADSTCGVGHVAPIITEYFRTVTHDRNADLSAANALLAGLRGLNCGGDADSAVPAATLEPGATCNAARGDVVLLIMDYHSRESGKAFYEALNEQMAGCPDGSLEHPYPFNTVASSLRVNHFIRPADLLTELETADDQTSVLVGVECTRDCDFAATDFTLTDGEGTSYEAVSLMDDYAGRMDFDVAVAERDQTAIVFVVPANATNLRLVYGAQTAYAVEPGREAGIVVTSDEEINIYSHPGAEFQVVAVLSAGNPQIVYGRNENGTWVQTTAGWMETSSLKLDGDVMGLNVTAPGQ